MQILKNKHGTYTGYRKLRENIDIIKEGDFLKVTDGSFIFDTDIIPMFEGDKAPNDNWYRKVKVKNER